MSMNKADYEWMHENEAKEINIESESSNHHKSHKRRNKKSLTTKNFFFKILKTENLGKKMFWVVAICSFLGIGYFFVEPFFNKEQKVIKPILAVHDDTSENELIEKEPRENLNLNNNNTDYKILAIEKTDNLTTPPNNVDYEYDIEKQIKLLNLTKKEEQYYLAIRYLNRNESQNDSKEAIKWLTSAATQGHLEAMSRLSSVYYNGEKKDYSKSLFWGEFAAHQGHIPSQIIVAESYELGRGTEVSIPKALKWYQTAANQGDLYSRRKVEELSHK